MKVVKLLKEHTLHEAWIDPFDIDFERLLMKYPSLEDESEQEKQHYFGTLKQGEAYGYGIEVRRMF